MNYLNGQDIASYSKDLFQQVDLGRKDMLLVIESSSQAWYLVYGGGLRTYAENNDALAALLKGTGLATDKATEYYHNYEEVAIDSADVDDIMNVKGAALTAC